MLVICEDCAKKYNIDESKIKGNRARFTCKECGHIIIVDKSDLSRPLVRSADQHQSSDDKSHADGDSFLKGSGTQTDIDNKPGDDTGSQTIKKKKKSLPIPAYFLIGGIIAFLITNGGIGYVLSQHFDKISADIIITGLLVSLVTWVISLGVLFGIGFYLSRSVNQLTASINRFNQGDKEVNITVKGPSEVTGMGQALSLLFSKIK